MLELTDAKFDKERNVKDLQKQIDKMAVGDDTKFLFDTVQQKQQQTLKGFQPGASVQQKSGTEIEPIKMNYNELCTNLAKNPDIYLGE